MSKRREMISYYFGILRAAEARRIASRGMNERDRMVAVALADAEIRCARRIAVRICNRF